MKTKSDPKKLYLVISIALLLFSVDSHAQLSIRYEMQSGPVNHGVQALRNTLINHGIQVSFSDRSSKTEPDILVISDSLQLLKYTSRNKGIDPADIKPEGYQIIKPGSHKEIIIAARDATGAMYGLMTLNNFAKLNKDIFLIPAQKENPHFEYRIIKFNLPWSPYRDSPATRFHLQTCRDLSFWEKFLDMMAEDRFNALSLWNLHPFTFMIRPKDFPLATPFSDREMKDWQDFWKQLFRMAKDRGIQTFIVNWNIVVSPEFARAYGTREFNDTSQLVRNYTRECVTQVINEYPDLTGIGVTLADWMNDMPARRKEDWIEDTFIEGMKQANRKVKFLHRSVLSGSPIEMRRVIDHAGLEEPALVEVKFNWSHGHSTPHLSITHDYNSGVVDTRFWDPRPEHYHIEWMIRNEDFFILRWGQPDFIRQHIMENTHDYVDGYFIGSEGYIPALDYSSRDVPEKVWQYGFEKQWLFYMLWGRLLYNPHTPDSLFEEAFDLRYGKGLGRDMLTAITLASDMPLKLASFYRATWDYTLYSEGFLAPQPAGADPDFDSTSAFISIDELTHHPTLDPDLVSIQDYVNLITHGQTVPQGRITPLQLAGDLEQKGHKALEITEKIKKEQLNNFSAVHSELEDVVTWSYLSFYFAEKLRGGVDLETFRQSGDPEEKTKAISHLDSALSCWEKVIEHTQNRYQPVPLVSLEENSGNAGEFSWEYYLPEVKRDIQIAESSVYLKQR